MKKITMLTFALISASIMNSQMMIQLEGNLQGIGAFSSRSSNQGTSESKSSSGAVQVAYGLGFSKSINENLVGTINLSKLGGRNWGGSDPLTYDYAGQSWISIEPGVNYFFDEAYRGVYVGGKLGYKQGLDDASFSTASLRARVGKLFSISDVLKFGVEGGLGYELGFGKTVVNIDYSGPSGLCWGFGLNVGYVFGEN